MIKLLNFLFGWDYILWKNFADSGVSRVHVLPDGKVYYWRYRLCSIIDLIQKPNDVLWLTCLPSKYFPPARAVEAVQTKEDVLKPKE